MTSIKLLKHHFVPLIFTQERYFHLKIGIDEFYDFFFRFTQISQRFKKKLYLFLTKGGFQFLFYGKSQSLKQIVWNSVGYFYLNLEEFDDLTIFFDLFCKKQYSLHLIQYLKINSNITIIQVNIS